MDAWTDNPEFAETFLDGLSFWENSTGLHPSNLALSELAGILFSRKPVYRARTDTYPGWKHVFITPTSQESHFDLLVNMNRGSLEIPDGILSLVGSGSRLHGQHGRPWIALEGNIHLTVYLDPQRRIERIASSFQTLAAVSVLQAIDDIPHLRGKASFKWVNDILIEGTKVAGFLVHTQTIGDMVAASILGIGLNVEQTPTVESDEFASVVTSLRDHVPDSSICNRKTVLKSLLSHLRANTDLLLRGESGQLVDIYRKRSAVIGRGVTVISDSGGEKGEVIASGRVRDIGDDLELWIEDIDRPVVSGRLIFDK